MKKMEQLIIFIAIVLTLIGLFIAMYVQNKKNEKNIEFYRQSAIKHSIKINYFQDKFREFKNIFEQYKSEIELKNEQIDLLERMLDQDFPHHVPEKDMYISFIEDKNTKLSKEVDYYKERFKNIAKDFEAGKLVPIKYNLEDELYHKENNNDPIIKRRPHYAIINIHENIFEMEINYVFINDKHEEYLVPESNVFLDKKSAAFFL